jgi:hypothetical protein
MRRFLHRTAMLVFGALFLWLPLLYWLADLGKSNRLSLWTQYKCWWAVAWTC